MIDYGSAELFAPSSNYDKAYKNLLMKRWIIAPEYKLDTVFQGENRSPLLRAEVSRRDEAAAS